MKRWYSLLEIVQFPLKMFFIAIVLMSMGDFFINPNITPYIYVQNEMILTFCQFLKYLGSFLISSVPMLVVIKMLSKRYEDSVPAYVGVVTYLLFHIVTMFVASTDLPSYCYSTMLGMQIDSKASMLSSVGMRYPLVTGFLSSIIVVIITRYCYHNSRRRFTYGILSFIDNDSWSLLSSMVLTTVAAVLFSLGWPYFLGGLENIFSFIAADIYNPANLFAYGVTERILSVFGLQDLIHNPFWLGNLGGSWMDAFGKSYTGDVSIWTALIAQNLDTFGYGRFITPYYVMNIFAVPGMLLSFYCLLTDKMERRRYGLFYLLAALTSIFAGTLIPLEIFLLIAAPALFFLHILGMSALYAFFSTLSIGIGYTYTGSLTMAMPGTLISLLPYLGVPEYSEAIMTIVSIGFTYFFFYFAVTRLYYKLLSGDFLNPKHNKERLDTFLEAVGGVANIKIINSSLNKISIYLYDPTLLDYELLNDLDVYRVAETRAGLSMEFGPSSTILKDGVRREMKRYQKELAAKPVVQKDQSIQQ
ncbi:MAG: PTS transporter subunit EIIC [Erysipelotrichaceae bacterium]|nr:PTS transporter subunit EIIC [Erysipelotrichaceae bacterium]